ncbi:MAG: hypothetical protein N2112_02510 [Gemmataceae bacterium]|nr:hypothetical protein [Gemmataceae bacterium]
MKTQPMPVPVPPAKTAMTEGLVEIFSAGTLMPNGKVADLEFLQKVVDNWHKYQAKRQDGFFRAPAYLIPAASVAVGHEENSSINQSYADRTDLPAVGWPDDLQIVGEKLCCRFRGVPVPLARWINAGNYSEISAEFYLDYKGVGPCLRRVSILGAEIPNCKDLASIPTLVYEPEDETAPNILAFAEKVIKSNHSKTMQIQIGDKVLKFSEKPIMDRNQLLAALKEAGVDILFVNETTPNELLASMVQALQMAKAPTQNTEPANTGEEPKPSMTNGGGCNPADPVKNAETKLLNELAKSKAFYESETKRLRDERVHAECVFFCEQHKDKIYPYEMDPKVGVTLLDQLKSASEDKVLKFSDNGKEIYISPREALMATIAKRPVIIKNRELLEDPANSPDRMSEDEKRRALAASPTGLAALARKKP